MEKRKRRVLLICGIVLGYLVVAVIVMLIFSRPDFHSPAGVKRGVEGGPFGLLEGEFGEEVMGRPASAVMAVPERTAGEGEDFVLEWRGEEEVEEEEIERWVKALAGDDELELVGFATWYPAAGDDVSEGATWEADVVFRDAETLEVFGDGVLSADGVPERFFRLEPPREYVTPKMRLLFRVRGMDYPRVVSVVVGDARTGVEISYDQEDLGEGPAMDREGEWLRFDLSLLAWHDTPLDLIVQVLTGEPEVVEVGAAFGAQVVLGEKLRLQWLGEVEGRMDLGYSPARNFVGAAGLEQEAVDLLKERLDDEAVAAWVEVEQPAGWTPQVVLRTSSEEFLVKHCGRLRGDGSVNWKWRVDDGSGVVLASTEREGGGGEPVKLVLLPEVAELSWRLGGLPDAPTPGQPENLFEVVMPRVKCDDEQELFGVIATATQLEWGYERLWKGSQGKPDSFPKDEMFRDVTPKELLHWYLKETRGGRVVFDEESLSIEFNEERRSFAEWWDDVMPRWLQF